MEKESLIPHPIISYGTMKKEKQVSLKKHIEKVTAPIFAKALGVPQEELSNSMTTTNQTIKKIWRPNNYRREIKVKEKSNSILQEIGGLLGLVPLEKYVNSHTKILSIKNYEPNITIQYFKKTLVAIYHQRIINGNKEEFIIECKTAKEITEIIDSKKKEITEKIDQALFKFAKKCKILMPYTRPSWIRYEDFHRGDSYIDKLPKDLILHSEHFKKVYGKGIEFISNELGDEPTEKIENYITNQTLLERLPDITNSIDNLSLRFDKFIPRILDMMEYREKVDKELAINIKTHNKVFSKLDTLLTKTVGLGKWL